MKLQTEIKPRRDGVVLLDGLDGVKYKFEPNEAGDLVCDVAHEPTLAFVLAGASFFPADEADFDAAMAIAGGDDDDDDTDEQEEGGMPVEANTPIKVRAKPGPKPKQKLTAE